jgi:hypothetical protein
VTHTPCDTDRLYDAAEDVTDMITVTPGIAEVLDLLGLPHGTRYRMTRHLRRQVHGIEARLAEARRGVATGTEAVRQRDRMWRAEQDRKTAKDTAS